MAQHVALCCVFTPFFLVATLAVAALHCAAGEQRAGGMMAGSEPASGGGGEEGQGHDSGRPGLFSGNEGVCGIGWAGYSSLHERILATGEGGIVSFKPDPWRGYANQLLGISSAFAVALLTDRAFFIDDGGSFSRIFHSPHIRWQEVGAARLAAERRRRSSRSISSLGSSTGEEESRVGGDGDSLDGLDEGIFVWDDLKDCDAEESIRETADAWDLSEMLGSFDQVEISTNILWWPNLFRNPLYSGLVSSWGMRSTDDFFSCAMSYLLVPAETLDTALAPLRFAMSRSSFTVGIQLRLNHETAQVRHEDAEHFLECGRSALLSGWAGGGDAVEVVTANKTIAFVVGTDDPGVIDGLRGLLRDGEEIVWWDAAQDDGTGRSNGTQPGDQERIAHGLKRAADHYALSLCNLVIVSFGSTFGLTAAHMQPGKGRHLAIGRHYHQRWVSPQCEPSPCPGHGDCFDKAFGYFGLCDTDFEYGHGQDFLAWARQKNPKGHLPPRLSAPDHEP